MKLILVLLLCSFVLAVLTHTIEFYYRKLQFLYAKLIKKAKVPEFNKENLSIVIKRVVKDLDKNLAKYLILDSQVKWKIWTYIFAFCYLSIMLELNIQVNNELFTIFSYTMLIILLIGIGDFIHSVRIEGFSKILFYLMKWCIFMIYPFVLLDVFLKDLSRIDILLITVGVLLGYSFLFVKYIIDSFKYYIFQFVNFVVILIFFNLFIIGLTFGAFYLENNNIYKFFTEEEVNKLYESAAENEGGFDYQDIIIIVIKGIEPFFNFPSEMDYGNMYFIPIMEHLIGNIYLLLIIGFFVSYSVGLLIERKKIS
ncbi:hypothetical protein J22TS1_48390 [Siminovitchia terrae]|uniref:hypothetical protein n=1 Tax=Siminovitchia terrae TaxID=1914933 RepID=UPI001B17CF83|nr:hypothetical protein [Siminovitchia terrae]GIN93788.1 hypothetical protein J22TS1_48390 [Siminovitchia terrae]